MAMLEGEGVWGSRRAFPKPESGTETAVVEPTLYSKRDLGEMMAAPPPPGLSAETRIQTPIGTWSMDGNIPVFDSRPEAEIAEVTKESLRQRLRRLAIQVFRMS